MLEINITHSFVLCVPYIQRNSASKGQPPTLGQALAAGAIAALREGRRITCRRCSSLPYVRPEHHSSGFAA
eukprot:7720204-Pyramimonas_sp.AAC.1